MCGATGQVTELAVYRPRLDVVQFAGGGLVAAAQAVAVTNPTVLCELGG